MCCELVSQTVSLVQPRSDVAVGASVSNSVSVLHTEKGLQLLSELDVADVDSKSLNGLQMVSREHIRLDVAVGAVDSYCHSKWQDIVFLHSGGVSAL